MMKEFISVTSHALYPPPVTNCNTFSDPIPPWVWRTLWTPPKSRIRQPANWQEVMQDLQSVA